jgi:predicted methyltransferase
VAAEALAAVAEAVGLREGPRGVEEVLRHLAGPAPAIRRLSRRTSIPVPVVAAICNELRAAGLLAPGRPVRLSEAGRELVDRLGGGLGVDAACPACAGLGVAAPGEPADTAGPLAGLLAGAPPADPTLDQVHCTVATKLRRVAYLRQSGALDGRSVLLLGDDDFLALAIALEATAPGRRAPARLTVLDADPGILAFTRTALRGTGVAAELVLHDLRQPLPRRLTGAFDTVFTDPPYTHRGAELFLSRGREALRPEGGHAFLCFGPQAPADGARLQHAITGLGFAIHRLARNFNEYLGAGVLAGTSHLYHLVGAGAGETEAEAGGLYTWERGGAPRTYSCRGCGAHLTVGPGRRPATVLALRERGCPHCRGRAFQPGPRGARALS